MNLDNLNPGYLFSHRTPHIELYDLPTEAILAYFEPDGCDTRLNEDYLEYLVYNSYRVCLTDISDYVEGYTNKEYYSLDEIRELEPQIAEGLKIINSAKTKTK